jgi:hypothetical protein
MTTNIQQFDYTVTLDSSLLWQYNDAESLQSLIEQKQTWYNDNQEQFWTDWYNDVFNLQTANEFGLSVWSIILNLPYFISDAGIPEINWGFGVNNKNFNNGNFQSQATNINLTTDQQRLMLQLRYYQLTSRGDIVRINEALNTIFPAAFGVGNTCYVIDDLDMTISYVFTFDVPQDVRQVLVQYDLLPRSAGVGIKYRVLSDDIWGFGVNNKNFNNGGFEPQFI